MKTTLIGNMVLERCEPSKQFTGHGKTITRVFGDFFLIPNIYPMCFVKIKILRCFSRIISGQLDVLP